MIPVLSRNADREVGQIVSSELEIVDTYQTCRDQTRYSKLGTAQTGFLSSAASSPDIGFLVEGA
jgi:hypothetical protein